MCWPLALLALILYPIVWLILLPFRILGFAVDGVLGLVKGIIMLPSRVLRGRPANQAGVVAYPGGLQHVPKHQDAA